MSTPREAPEQPAPPSDTEQPQVEPAEDPTQRATQCGEAIEAVLRRYGCRIGCHIRAQPIGSEELVSKALLETTWHVIAQQTG